jgi:AcrR family transcriptional regulator
MSEENDQRALPDTVVAASNDMNELDQAKREKVFLAAKERFSRFGFKKTTVDEIADLAGVSKRTMYQVFNSKEDILAQLVMFEALSFRHHCLGEIKSHSDSMEKLQIFCTLWRDYFLENPFLGQVLTDDLGLFTPFLKNTINLVESGMKEMIGRLVTEGVSDGAFRPLDLPATVDCILVLLREFAIKTPDRPEQYNPSAWIPFILHAVKA